MLEAKSKSQRIRRWVKRVLRRMSSSRIVWGAVIFVVVGLALPRITQNLFPPHHPQLQQFAERAGDGLIVAGIIALFLEGPGHAAINRALSEGVLWGVVNHTAPAYHRDALRRLAAHKTVISKVEWTIKCDEDNEDPELLRLTIVINSWGETFEETGIFPSGRAFILV